MEYFAKTLAVAIPIFIILIIIEAVYDWKKDKKTVRALDTISSLSSGMTNVIKDSLGIVVIIVSYPFLVENLALTEVKEANWVTYLLAFIAIDFAGYCNHRLSHSINYFWNRHRIHHSSEEFNLPCALRQTISSFIGVGVFFLIPAALMGVPHEVIVIIAPIQLYMQFWYHTRHIGKLGWLEYIIITPSQHRVHHAVNPIYLDKNLGQILSIWDRMFGTYQEELDDVPPVYGVTMPARTWNPIKINFQHLFLLFKDAWRTNKWSDRVKIFFGRTGWRPEGYYEKYPVEGMGDIYKYEKYDPPSTKAIIAWSWFQYVMMFFLTMYFLVNFKTIGTTGVFLNAFLIFVIVYGYTSVMDRDKNAIWIEAFRAAFGLVLLFQTGDWFGLANVVPGASVFLFFYFVSAPIAAWYFTKKEVLQPQVG